jgi:hypothetical protein
MHMVRSILSLLPYLSIQLVTRGGDWAIQNSIIYSFENQLVFIPAVVLGAMFNISSGYLLQKILVFPQTPYQATPKISNRFGTFVVLRGVFGATAFLTLSVLYIFWPEEYMIYSAVITLGMWLLTYQSQRDVFTGRLNQLPRIVRRTRVTVFQFPKKAKRFLQTSFYRQYKKVRT